MNQNDVTFTRTGRLVAKLPDGGEVTVAAQPDGRVIVYLAPGKWNLVSLFPGRGGHNAATFEQAS